MSLPVLAQRSPREIKSKVDQKAPTLLPIQRLTPDFTISDFGGFQSATPQFYQNAHQWTHTTRNQRFMPSRRPTTIFTPGLQNLEFQISNTCKPLENRSSELVKDLNQWSLRLDRWTTHIFSRLQKFERSHNMTPSISWMWKCQRTSPSSMFTILYQ